ncbi:hypothetical protein ROR02_09490 [Pararhodospirillum oryzae]|uniref:L,D-TPase catalytic domain-containing protein n=1 Tax=Pararhodospirillum oryzae TaxID=478448 RepID=A0A512H5V9_9PROT|nr:hypothetical protein ROR02_09490 [Pararhodospirillum oryzae]
MKQDKVEGDGATPAGVFALRWVFYRPDRETAPLTGLPVRALTPTLGWCDDPADPAYNREVTLPYPASAESMWRDDGLYDLGVVLGHNDDPVVPGAGSAVFLHVADPGGRPTAGCVALALADLRALLAVCGPATVLEIRAGA